MTRISPDSEQSCLSFLATIHRHEEDVVQTLLVVVKANFPMAWCGLLFQRTQEDIFLLTPGSEAVFHSSSSWLVKAIVYQGTLQISLFAVIDLSIVICMVQGMKPKDSFSSPFPATDSLLCTSQFLCPWKGGNPADLPAFCNTIRFIFPAIFNPPCFSTFLNCDTVSCRIGDIHRTPAWSSKVYIFIFMWPQT